MLSTSGTPWQEKGTGAPWVVPHGAPAEFSADLATSTLPIGPQHHSVAWIVGVPPGERSYRFTDHAHAAVEHANLEAAGMDGVSAIQIALSFPRLHLEHGFGVCADIFHAIPPTGKIGHVHGEMGMPQDTPEGAPRRVLACRGLYPIACIVRIARPAIVIVFGKGNGV